METSQCTWHAHFRHVYLGNINHFSSLKNNISSVSLASVSLVVSACYKHVLSVQLCICCDDEFMLLPTIHVGSQSFDKSNTMCCVFLQNAQVWCLFLTSYTPTWVTGYVPLDMCLNRQFGNRQLGPLGVCNWTCDTRYVNILGQSSKMGRCPDRQTEQAARTEEVGNRKSKVSIQSSRVCRRKQREQNGRRECTEQKNIE